jgi:hypothetical protein
MRVRGSSGFLIAVFVAAALLVPASHAADAAPAAPIREVPIHSSYENANRVVSRDDGVSVLLPDGHSLWLFGDTGIYQRVSGGVWNETRFIDGSTALQVKSVHGQVPQGAEYPSGVPARFVPVPNDVYLPDGSGRPCTYKTAAFPARWPTGAAVLPSNNSEVVVTYSVVCVTQQGGVDAIQAEGWGYMLYNWRTRHVDRGPVDVFRPRPSGAELGPAQMYGWPIFHNGLLTLFSSRCTKAFVVCTQGQVWKVTLPATVAALSNKSSYQRVQLRTDGSGQFAPLSVSVARYSNGLRLIEMDSIAGTYKVFSARSLNDPWHLRSSGTLPGCPTRTSFCFALAGHPELSTPTQLFVSYKNPDLGPGGHMVISAIAG